MPPLPFTVIICITLFPGEEKRLQKKKKLSYQVNLVWLLGYCLLREVKGLIENSPILPVTFNKINMHYNLRALSKELPWSPLDTEKKQMVECQTDLYKMTCSRNI